MKVRADGSTDFKSRKDRLDYLSAALDFYVKVIATCVVGALVVTVGVAFLGFQSANEIAITPFHSPPDLTQKGLDGDVLAAHFLSQLAEDDQLARAVGSDTFLPQAIQDRIQLSATGDGVSDIKVEIPHTGISLGTVDDVMRSMGKETDIDGEVFEPPTGPVMVVRYGDYASQRYAAPMIASGELPPRAAWEIYARFQPALYANFCLQRCDSIPWLKDGPWLVDALNRVARAGKARPAAWAYWRLARLASARGWGPDKGLAYLDASVAADPDFALAYDDRSNQKFLLGDREGAYKDLKVAIGKLSSHGQDLMANVRQVRLLEDRITLAEYRGDFLSALNQDATPVAADYDGYMAGVAVTEAMHQARLHNVGAARRLLAGRRGSKDYADLMALAWTAIAAEDWSGAEAALAQASASAKAEGDDTGIQSLVEAEPLHAFVLAKLGRAQDAAGLIARSSARCDFCRIEAGRIAAERRDWGAAEREFAAAASLAPDLPFADGAWGEMLLAKGDLPGALDKLRRACRLGPHFADPREALAETLLRSGQYQQALEAAQAAAQAAPGWSRPYLARGRALAGLGQAASAPPASP